MLSTITPIGERGRGHRYAATARWYITGAVIGGLALGTGTALAAAVVHRLAPSTGTASFLAVAATLLSVASDSRIGGFELPTHRRQVNERWLDEYRPWVYGGGFGAQVGTGLATYITTAANYLVVLLLALTGAPWFALFTCALFGLTRG